MLCYQPNETFCQEKEFMSVFCCYVYITMHISTPVTGHFLGASLTCPCTRCPATVRPGVSSSPCISGPNGSTSPVTSGSNVQVVLAQVFPM